MKKWTFHRILRMVSSYAMLFLAVAFSVTCCMMLFISTMQKTMGLELTQENITAAAKITFANVILITILFGVLDYIRRKWMVDRPVKRILKAADQITKGDFSVRISPLQGVGFEGFNQIIQAINQMAQELAGTETLRSDFIANVSHELKTPLAVMGNYAVMLQRPGVSEAEKNEYARAISQSANRLGQLITNILKLNKLENQQIYPHTSKFDLSEQLCACLLQFEDYWERKQLCLEPEIPEAVQICSDAELLSLVWNNLISNAIKFTPVGGTVAVCLEATESEILVRVRDTGCGISPEIGQHIFEKFYQGDTSHATEGNGLGLALVKRVVDILNGEISVQSLVGQGSTFTVKFRRNG